MVKIFVGTSGWMYDWNPNGFEWYVRNSGLNAVELNMSFYRFPYPSQIKGWYRRSLSRGIRWSVKVHRLVTHVYLLNEKAINVFKKFLDLFKPMDDIIDFYLLQLPPRFQPSKVYVNRIERFTKEFNLGWKLAIEWRHKLWFKKEWVSWAKELELTVVSVDAPEFRFYDRSGPYLYLRMHGRTAWYAHYYTDDELREVTNIIRSLNANYIYVFFNNNHDMLENARRMYLILRSTLR